MSRLALGAPALLLVACAPAPLEVAEAGYLTGDHGPNLGFDGDATVSSAPDFYGSGSRVTLSLRTPAGAELMALLDLGAGLAEGLEPGDVVYVGDHALDDERPPGRVELRGCSRAAPGPWDRDDLARGVTLEVAATEDAGWRRALLAATFEDDGGGPQLVTGRFDYYVVPR